MSFTFVLLLAALAILFLAARRPDQFKVERRITINAAPETIFPYLNDLHQFALWSPFEKLDPNMRRNYNDVQQGIGATYQWQGTGKAGQGRMEIVEQTVPSRVLIKLDFIKPMRASNQVEFKLQPQGESTEVSWTMRGATPFLAKIVHVFYDMERMCGKEFEAGLRQLKQLAETPSAATA